MPAPECRAAAGGSMTRFAARAVILIFPLLVASRARADELITVATPKNPFLAPSVYPIGHTNSAQNDSTNVAGPIVPSHALAAGEIETNLIGPGHLGIIASPEYSDGQRVLWTNNQHDIVKLDEKTLQPLARLALDGSAPFTEADGDAIVGKLGSWFSWLRIYHAVRMIRGMLPTDLASAYTMVDRDGVYYVGNARGMSAYGDARPGDRTAPIMQLRGFRLPDSVPGTVVGINMSFDGHIVLATDLGWMVALSRDFSTYKTVQLPHSDEAPAFNARMKKEGRVSYNWIRNSIAVDEQGGIYVAANGWMEKLVWDGVNLYADPARGAWAAAYPNSTDRGTGATPVLVGFGNSDRLVAITDGDAVMRVTLFWRDAIPLGWKAPDEAVSPRVAGMARVLMGDPNRLALQSEQAVVAAGYQMVVVNNEPASMPSFFPPQAKGLFISLLGDDPAYTPHGAESFRWDPAQHQLVEAWTNREVSSPNCVPYASLGSGTVYTVGAENGAWVLQGLRLTDGRLMVKYSLGGKKFNTMFSGIYVDGVGRVVYGGMLGTVRLSPR